MHGYSAAQTSLTSDDGYSYRVNELHDCSQVEVTQIAECRRCKTKEYHCRNTLTFCDDLWFHPDKEPPAISDCPHDVSLPVPSSTDRVSYSWVPPSFLDNSNAAVDVTQSCHGSTQHQCYQDGSGIFSLGVTMVMYKGRDKYGNENSCQFSVTVTGKFKELCILS